MGLESFVVAGRLKAAGVGETDVQTYVRGTEADARAEQRSQGQIQVVLRSCLGLAFHVHRGVRRVEPRSAARLRVLMAHRGRSNAHIRTRSRSRSNSATSTHVRRGGATSAFHSLRQGFCASPSGASAPARSARAQPAAHRGRVRRRETLVPGPPCELTAAWTSSNGSVLGV
jgi:hypothetical protein